MKGVNSLNIWKKIIAMIVVAIIVTRFLIFDIFALSAPSLPQINLITNNGPVLSFLQQVLLGLGVTSDISTMSLAEAEMKNRLDYYEEFGTFLGANEFYIDGQVVSGAEFTQHYFNESPDFWDTLEILKEAGLNLYNWIFQNEEHVIPSYTDVDMKGYGAVVVRFFENPGSWNISYGNYVVLESDGYYRLYRHKRQEYYRNYELSSTQIYTDNRVGSYLPEQVKVYGDVRNLDGTQISTGTTEDIIGETADGTAITPDMLNPDGSVTIDGVTYYPKDYLDLTKFDDAAIVDLLNQILATIENTAVIEGDNTLAEDIAADVAVELDIAELNGLQMPTGILTVFPFCIPFDFVRGMKLLSAKPEVPYFKADVVVPTFLGVPEQRWEFVIDLKNFEPVAVITRWTSLFSFSYVLILLTGKIVKGAGA